MKLGYKNFGPALFCKVGIKFSRLAVTLNVGISWPLVGSYEWFYCRDGIVESLAFFATDMHYRQNFQRQTIGNGRH